MSKKTLLNESTVRKFMKFANIGALTENFVSETYNMEEEEAEEGMRLEGEHAEGRHDEGRGDVMEAEHEEGRIDSLHEEDVEETLHAEGEHEEALHAEGEHEGDDAPVDDVELDAGGAELDMSEDEAMALAQGLVDALTDLTGHEFTASSAGGAEADVDLDAELPGDEGPVDDAPAEEEEVLEGVDMIDEDEVVSETLRRVTKRIKNMSKRNRMVETVTDRIMTRIKNGK